MVLPRLPLLLITVVTPHWENWAAFDLVIKLGIVQSCENESKALIDFSLCQDL